MRLNLLDTTNSDLTAAFADYLKEYVNNLAALLPEVLKRWTIGSILAKNVLVDSHNAGFDGSMFGINRRMVRISRD